MKYNSLQNKHMGTGSLKRRCGSLINREEGVAGMASLIKNKTFSFSNKGTEQEVRSNISYY